MAGRMRWVRNRPLSGRPPLHEPIRMLQFETCALPAQSISWGSEMAGFSSCKVRRRPDMSDVHDLEQDFKELLVTKRRAPAAKGRNPPCDSHAHHQASRNRTKLKTYRALRCLTIEIPSSPIESKGRKRLADVVGMKGSWPMCEEILCEKVFNDFAYRKIWSCARLFSHRNASAKLDFPPHPEQNGMFVVRVDLPIVSSCLPLSPRRVNESSLPDILETEEMLQPSARIDEMDDTPVRHMP
jgi:hypothetical protein